MFARKLLEDYAYARRRGSDETGAIRLPDRRIALRLRRVPVCLGARVEHELFTG